MNEERTNEANQASHYLLGLAKRNAQVYMSLPQTRALIVTGSAAEGVSDFYSDIDTIIYYDELPSEEALQAACEQNQGEGRRVFGERETGSFFESYRVHGVECQFAQGTVAGWEQEIAQVLEQLDVATPIQKALSGMQEAIPLYGEPLVRQWQSRLANYPDTLAEAMVKHFLTFFPVWGISHYFIARDATWWLHQILVEAEEHILGVLAGLNRLYFSSFQFKRMHRFIQHMQIAPTNLADRLDALLYAEPIAAIPQLKELVQETVALVEQHLPQIDTTAVRKSLDFEHQAWRPMEE
jgi:hypothetical protein